MKDERLEIIQLGIGHGDATLIRWYGSKQWTCLIDGGPSPTNLHDSLVKHGVDRLDLLIVSHLDSDHIDGLMSIVDKIPIDTYMGPAIPAFRRYLWLFGQRGKQAIERGHQIEQSLTAMGTDIIYPLEGYVSVPVDHTITLSILSPAPQLIRRLLTGDALWLFTEDQTPLLWALEPDLHEEEQTNAQVALDEALRRGVVTPADMASVQPEPVPEGVSSGELAGEWSKVSGQSPEFFGDNILNNTSLVVFLNARVAGRSHTALFPGDLENWSYLLAKHPMGLHADILKASHHGGRLYMQSEMAIDEVIGAIRPKAVLISACGRHDLPRTSFRQSAIRWGASVFCTSIRGLELVSGSPSSGECCHSINKCSPKTRDIRVIIDETGIRSNIQACHSGFGDANGPPIRIEQHVIHPSPIMSKLVEGELRKHILWVKKLLIAIHNDRRRNQSNFGASNMPIPSTVIEVEARSQGRHSLVANLYDILIEGGRRGQYWVSGGRYRSDTILLYALPTDAEITDFLTILEESQGVLFIPRRDKNRDVLDDRSRRMLLSSLDTSGLASIAHTRFCFPVDCFEHGLWPHLVTAFNSSAWHCYLIGDRESYLYSDEKQRVIFTYKPIKTCINYLLTHILELYTHNRVKTVNQKKTNEKKLPPIRLSDINDYVFTFETVTGIRISTEALKAQLSVMISGSGNLNIDHIKSWISCIRQIVSTFHKFSKY